jgi:hypothetical protein
MLSDRHALAERLVVICGALVGFVCLYILRCELKHGILALWRQYLGSLKARWEAPPDQFPLIVNQILPDSQKST